MQKTKRGVYIFIWVVFSILLISSPAYAGFFDWFEDFRARITGEVTQVTDINITLGAGGGAAPTVIDVFNDSTIGQTLNEGIVSTNFTVNFSVVDTDGAGNLDDSKAGVNFTATGEDVRYNSTCKLDISSGDNANYTCEVIMWWWDGSGTWTINATAIDNNGNRATNGTETFLVSATTGFVQSPGNITFATLTAGSTNNTATNDALVLNNTGNQDIAQTDISINATDLVGEANSAFALYTGNFSVGNTTGGSVECQTTNSSAGLYTDFATTLYNVSGTAYVNISTAIMNASNFTINNGREGQEQLYFCNLLAGSELTQQAYSTLSNGPWTVQIV